MKITLKRRYLQNRTASTKGILRSQFRWFVGTETKWIYCWLPWNKKMLLTWIKNELQIQIWAWGVLLILLLLLLCSSGLMTLCRSSSDLSKRPDVEAIHFQGSSLNIWSWVCGRSQPLITCLNIKALLQHIKI